MLKTTSRVSGELMKEALDEIEATNGIRPCELAKALKIGQTTALTAIRQLLELNCISKGAVKYERKDGEVIFKTGYLYEQDLPEGFVITKRRQRKQAEKGHL